MLSGKFCGSYRSSTLPSNYCCQLRSVGVAHFTESFECCWQAAAYVGHMTSIVSQDLGPSVTVGSYIYVIHTVIIHLPLCIGGKMIQMETAASGPPSAPLWCPWAACLLMSHSMCNLVTVYELTGSFSLPWKAGRVVFFWQDILEWGTGRGCFLSAFGASGGKKKRVTNH